MSRVVYKANEIGIMLDDLGLTPESAQRAVMRVAHESRREWVNLASSRLSTSRNAYVSAIGKVEETPTGARIVLGAGNPKTERFANMVEQGCERFDMRDTILTSPKAKTAKDGHKYMSIPFRSAAPGAVMADMGKRQFPYEGDEGRKLFTRQQGFMAREAKKTDQDTGMPKWRDTFSTPPTEPGGKWSTKWGTRLPEMTARGTNLGGDVVKKHHTTGLLTGAYREVQGYEKVKQTSALLTFRTISDKNDNMTSWQHPGIKERNFAHEVAEFAVRRWPAIVRVS
jgi:hypothetical protein